MIIDWIERKEVLLPINLKNYNFRGKKNSQVMKERENLRQLLMIKTKVVIGLFKLQLWMPLAYRTVQ